MLTNERNPTAQPVKFDNEASMREARSRISFEQLLQQYGVSPSGVNWGSMECPICKGKTKRGGKKLSAGLFSTPTGVRLFRCHRTCCPSGGKSLNEIGFIAAMTGLTKGDAFEAYLKMAGVWQERAKFKPRQPKKALPAPEQVPADPPVSPAPQDSSESFEAAATASPTPDVPPAAGTVGDSCPPGDPAGPQPQAVPSAEAGSAIVDHSPPA